MSEDEILDNLVLMAASIQLVQSRFAKIMTASDFVDSAEGIVLLDAIVMRLQIIGEIVKIMTVGRMCTPFVPSPRGGWSVASTAVVFVFSIYHMSELVRQFN